MRQRIQQAGPHESGYPISAAATTTVAQNEAEGCLRESLILLSSPSRPHKVRDSDRRDQNDWTPDTPAVTEPVRKPELTFLAFGNFEIQVFESKVVDVNVLPFIRELLVCLRWA